MCWVIINSYAGGDNMKKIIVAGAGHGGLIAAAKLAEKGYPVIVIERKSENEMGHDWEDRFTFSVLEKLGVIKEAELPADCWRFRGDCAFVSPAKRKKVVINYTAETRQRIMWRKPLIRMLIENARRKGAEIKFGINIELPLCDGKKIIGLRTSAGDIYGDMVIDAAGVFSPVRTKLPGECGIEKSPKHGDLFYAYRAYFSRDNSYPVPGVPFEVYMYHEGEQGLSWFNTNEDNCDVLIGRINKIDDVKVEEQLEIFRKDHPWLGDKILHGGNFGIIPVRRPLTLMVADGYAAVGDSAFMTTPMNGMGIDLSMLAGGLLADTVSALGNSPCTAEKLWAYNRDFHRLYGGDTAKNEGLKNAILSLPSEGVDFLFESEVIQSSDLAGAGRNTKLSALLGKFGRGMKKPPYFFSLLKGLIKGSKASGLYKKAPESFDREAVSAWSRKISELDIKL